MTAAEVDQRMNPGSRSAIYVDYKLSSPVEEDDIEKRLNARRLSVSRSGRCKKISQLRVKLPSEDQYRCFDDGTSPAIGNTVVGNTAGGNIAMENTASENSTLSLVDNIVGSRPSPTVDRGGPRLPIALNAFQLNNGAQSPSALQQSPVIISTPNVTTNTSPLVSGQNPKRGNIDKFIGFFSGHADQNKSRNQSSPPFVSSVENSAIFPPASPKTPTLTIFNESASNGDIESTAF